MQVRLMNISKNIQRASELAKDLWRAGFAVVCPHTNTAFFGGVVPEQEFIDGCLEILSRCDAIACVPGWENSVGSCGEVALAKLLNLPIITDFEIYGRISIVDAERLTQKYAQEELKKDQKEKKEEKK
jgi:hypothetical protein